MDQESRLDYLIDYLLHEQKHTNQEMLKHATQTVQEKMKLFRGLCNVREAIPVSEQFLERQDAYLTEWNNERKVTSLHDLESIGQQDDLALVGQQGDLALIGQQLYVWQGDITSLAVDAIVNAANSDFLGCMQANHNCIDNIIHTRAGVQLRLDCHALITAQGRKEAMGKAKITQAYNLPADYVIHTVGPFIDARGVSPLKEQLLASSYRSCLALADAHTLGTIAFCCISTGEFNFPNERAAEIAIETVEKYLLDTHSKLNVIFNVFKDEDHHIYRRLTGSKTATSKNEMK